MCRGDGKVELAVFPGIDFQSRLGIAHKGGAGLDSPMGVDDQVGRIIEDGDNSLYRILGLQASAAKGGAYSHVTSEKGNPMVCDIQHNETDVFFVD